MKSSRIFKLLALTYLISACGPKNDNSGPVYDESIFTAPKLRTCNGDFSAAPIYAKYYVDPNGNDLGSGSKQEPFKTISRARKAARKISRLMTGDISIKINDGDYFLKEPLTFTSKDSGRNGFKIRYGNGGHLGGARIIGGEPVKGWRRYSGQIFVAPIAHELDFYTLYENGVRAEEARFPNRNLQSQFPLSHGAYLLSPGVEPSGQVFNVNSSDLPHLDQNDSRLRIFSWGPPGAAWFTDVTPVKNVDVAGGKINLTEALRYDAKGAPRYFLLGDLLFLDAPGEFYVDKRKDLIFYWPRGSEIEKSEIIIPKMKTILNIKGTSPELPVENISFSGLRFEATDFTRWYRYGWPTANGSGENHVASDFDRQIDMTDNRLGLITLENTKNIDITFSAIKNSGFSAVYALFANQGACFYGDLIEDAGIHGIAIQGRYPGEGNTSLENVVSNVFILRVGELAGHGSGIDVSNSGSNSFSNLIIQGSSRTGIVLHAGGSSIPGFNYAQRNLFENIKILNVTQDSGDVGAVYVVGLSAEALRSNKFENIYIEGIVSDPTMKDWTPVGVFSDALSSVQIFKNIIVDGAPTHQYREYTKAYHVFENVSWISNFDISRININAIGLKSDFPDVYLKEKLATQNP